MKTLLRIEEAAMFGLGIWAFSRLPFAWWWFLVLLLLPDVSMIGYVFGNKTGAFLYNLFHHKAIAIGVFFWGMYLNNDIIQLAGIILFAHASMDRMLGYGLKTNEGFGFTHLGKIGK